VSELTTRRLLSRYLAAREELPPGVRRNDGRSAAEGACPPRSAYGRRLRTYRGLRDRLVAHYVPLARAVARRAAPRPPHPFDAADVVSWGMRGLLEAVETYDPHRGVPFECYATSKVRWSVLDELRRADPLPRRVRAHARRAEGVRAAREQALGRAPTEREIAEELGLPLAVHRANLGRFRAASSCCVSLEPAPPDAPTDLSMDI
jgi:RNA polymerase sigma factor (sigma-70 family)